jgi:hypothetical protein
VISADGSGLPPLPSPLLSVHIHIGRDQPEPRWQIEDVSKNVWDI